VPLHAHYGVPKRKGGKQNCLTNHFTRPESLTIFANIFNRVMIIYSAKITVCIAAIPACDRKCCAEGKKKIILKLNHHDIIILGI